MKLNYVVEGKGEPLIFLHGLSDNLRYWEVLTSTLRKKYQVIRIDLRGHGESELGDDEITIDTYADDLKNLLDDFAIRYTNYVSSIVLMSTFVKCDENITATLFTVFVLLELTAPIVQSLYAANSPLNNATPSCVPRCVNPFCFIFAVKSLRLPSMGIPLNVM